MLYAAPAGVESTPDKGRTIDHLSGEAPNLAIETVEDAAVSECSAYNRRNSVQPE